MLENQLYCVYSKHHNHDQNHILNTSEIICKKFKSQKKIPKFEWRVQRYSNNKDFTKVFVTLPDFSDHSDVLKI